jgi:hypothetical protein
MCSKRTIISILGFFAVTLTAIVLWTHNAKAQTNKSNKKPGSVQQKASINVSAQKNIIFSTAYTPISLVPSPTEANVTPTDIDVTINVEESTIGYTKKWNKITVHSIQPYSANLKPSTPRTTGQHFKLQVYKVNRVRNTDFLLDTGTSIRRLWKYYPPGATTAVAWPPDGIDIPVSSNAVIEYKIQFDPTGGPTGLTRSNFCLVVSNKTIEAAKGISSVNFIRIR